MGTRNLTCVHLDGKFRVAQYCQWDGYPSGQGVTILEFLRNTDLKAFKEKCRNLKWITDKVIKKLWVEAGADPNSDMATLEVADRFASAHPELHRDCGAKVLHLIDQTNGKLRLRNDLYFAQDSLFCEWAYVIDFDEGVFKDGVLEVYQGFVTKEPSGTGRFDHLGVTTSGYYPYSSSNLFPWPSCQQKRNF